MPEQTKSKHVKRGRRYSPAEKTMIMSDADDIGVAEAAEKHSCSKWTIYDWRRKKDRDAKVAETKSSADNEQAVAIESQDERQQLVLKIWKQQPGLGPSQIRNQLKRKGFKISVNTVRAIMEEGGYVQPKVKRREHTGEYEAIRPFQMYHMDFAQFFVHKQRQCMLLMIDDFSRFIPGWALLESEHADGVINEFDAAVNRYGKPEAVMSDGGSGFHSWRGMSRFEATLEEYGVDFYIAKEARINGKAEALVDTVKKELIRTTEFADLADARRQIARWVRFYNYERTHHGLGGLLVPADRFHGWQKETLKRIEQGNGADFLDLLNHEGRGLELFKVVSVAGQPAVYLMGKKLLG